MKLFLLLSVQAAAAPAPAAPVKVDAIEFDLAKVKPADPCDDRAQGQGPDIVVCGHRQPYAYPLEAMAKIYEPKPLRAQVGLGNGATADVHLEDATIANGVVSHRAMVRIKIPF